MSRFINVSETMPFQERNPFIIPGNQLTRHRDNKDERAINFSAFNLECQYLLYHTQAGNPTSFSPRKWISLLDAARAPQVDHLGVLKEQSPLTACSTCHINTRPTNNSQSNTILESLRPKSVPTTLYNSKVKNIFTPEKYNTSLGQTISQRPTTQTHLGRPPLRSTMEVNQNMNRINIPNMNRIVVPSLQSLRNNNDKLTTPRISLYDLTDTKRDSKRDVYDLAQDSSSSDSCDCDGEISLKRNPFDKFQNKSKFLTTMQIYPRNSNSMSSRNVRKLTNTNESESMDIDGLDTGPKLLLERNLDSIMGVSAAQLYGSPIKKTSPVKRIADNCREALDKSITADNIQKHEFLRAKGNLSLKGRLKHKNKIRKPREDFAPALPEPYESLDIHLAFTVPKCIREYKALTNKYPDNHAMQIVQRLHEMDVLQKKTIQNEIKKKDSKTHCTVSKSASKKSNKTKPSSSTVCDNNYDQGDQDCQTHGRPTASNTENNRVKLPNQRTEITRDKMVSLCNATSLSQMTKVVDEKQPSVIPQLNKCSNHTMEDKEDVWTSLRNKLNASSIKDTFRQKILTTLNLKETDDLFRNRLKNSPPFTNNRLHNTDYRV